MKGDPSVILLNILGPEGGLLMKLLGHRPALPGKEISFLSCPLDPAYTEAGMPGHLPATRSGRAADPFLREQLSGMPNPNNHLWNAPRRFAQSWQMEPHGQSPCLPQAGVVPCATLMWGDTSRLASGQAGLRWRIPPPGKYRGVFCCRNKIAVLLKREEGMGHPLDLSHPSLIEGLP
jgi:hypothetical protein